jgi:hypothetical protein
MTATDELLNQENFEQINKNPIKRQKIEFSQSTQLQMSQ